MSKGSGKLLRDIICTLQCNYVLCWPMDDKNRTRIRVWYCSMYQMNLMLCSNIRWVRRTNLIYLHNIRWIWCMLLYQTQILVLFLSPIDQQWTYLHCDVHIITLSSIQEPFLAFSRPEKSITKSVLLYVFMTNSAYDHMVCHLYLHLNRS